MKIGLDLRCLPTDGSEGSGIAHAARALCGRLVADKSVDWIAYLPAGATFLPLNKGESEGVIVKSLNAPSGSAQRRALRTDPCDLLFVPSGAIPSGIHVPAIPWIHDLIILDHPEWFPESWLRRQLTTRLVLRGIKRAPIVFAVSERTKRAIVGHTGVDAGRVVVTGEGGDEVLRSMTDEELRAAREGAAMDCEKRWGMDGPFVLALGTVEPRKNLALLIRAWRASVANSSAASQAKGVGLVVAGHWGWKCDDVKREIADLPAESRRRLLRIENVSDHDKRTLLLAASAVAVPSLDEGFGLVALEAMQAGTPVMISDRGALPEVAGQAAAKLDPLDEGAWARALANVGLAERPKIFNSVGLAAAVNALKGRSSSVQPVSIVSAPQPAQTMGRNGQVTPRVRNSFPGRSDAVKNRTSKYTWERTARIVLDGLSRCV